MRLDFNILWVEDQPANVTDQRDRIKSQLGKEGFRLQTQFAKSVDEANHYLGEDIYGDHIDLILMDFDLGAGKSGADGLVGVRDQFPYKDLIFYSASATANLAQTVKALNIQGVFTAYRPDLPSVVEGVFENLVRKVLDIDHSRGIVLGATSDIDDVVLNNLVKHFDDCSEEAQKAIISGVMKRLEEKAAKFHEDLQALKSITHVGALIDYHSIYTSDDRFRLLQKILKLLSLHSGQYPDFDRYRAEVVPRRNELAHIQVVKNGFSRKFFDRKGKELSSDDMRTLRVALLEFQELLDELFVMH